MGCAESVPVAPHADSEPEPRPKFDDGLASNTERTELVVFVQKVGHTKRILRPTADASDAGLKQQVLGVRLRCRLLVP